jgi:hypothetical protein
VSNRSIEVFDFSEADTLAAVGDAAEREAHIVAALCRAWLHTWTLEAPARVVDA